MEYLKPKFNVPGPGPNVDWPFPPKRDLPADATAVCQVCGGATIPGQTHMDARDEGRPRRRVCFGKPA